MANRAFSSVNWCLGLLIDVKRASLERLLDYSPEMLEELAKIFDTKNFADTYPKEELQDAIEITCADDLFEAHEMSDSEIWNQIVDKYIIPAGYKLAGCTINRSEDIERANFDKRAAWKRVSDNIARWKRTPYFPDVYATIQSRSYNRATR